MDLNEIKKALYKEKSVAQVQDKLEDIWVYATHCSLGWVSFGVPLSEMGETKFNDEEPARLLIRWIRQGVD